MAKSGIFLYPDGDPKHSQNLMGSKLDKDHPLILFRKIQADPDCDIFFLCPHSDPEHSQNVMESNRDQDPSSERFQDDPSSSICIIWRKTRQVIKAYDHGNKQRNGQTGSHENNTSLVEVINKL